MIRKLGNAVLATGSSQIFWFLSLPVIAKIYTQEDLGVYSQIIAYAATIGLVVGARADLAVLTAPKRSALATRSAFVKLSLVLLLPIALLAYLTGRFAEVRILQAPTIIFVLAGAYLGNMFLLNGVSLVRADKYSSLRNSGLARSAAQTCAQLSLFSFGLGGLIVGKLIGDVTGVLLRKRQLTGSGAAVKPPLPRRIFTREECFAIRKNAAAFKFSLPQSIVSSATQNSPYFLLPLVLNSAQMGQFAMAFALVISPVGLIGAPVRQTFMAHLGAQAHGRSAELRLLRRSTALLLALGTFGWASFYLLAPIIIKYLLGESWMEVVDYARILATWSAFGVASIPSAAYLLAKSRNKLHLQIEMLTGVFRVGGLVIGLSFFKESLTLWPFVLASIAQALATIFIALHLSAQYEGNREIE